ncbi:Suppressor protein stp22 of temperature-sensitive alpha-factor receptor and arginine permease [Cladophialophora chaetospira]|uniref:Suppressor protein stp22 of temperature-sensitive alpha-factor receptor and arginine permease n=1 Tax=Cladophialophora chaetospira TaxID=386627 RepID=A0AA39CCC1_9EURO|nr:Suppressor protein stp22 of temperature-sensitive alpha-factor receptor and arginine permease [Cladophialophora chaetospira]
MAGVPQKTLTWLYDVLKREYRDPNRTYSDLAHVLARYQGFAPRTDVYTSDTGAPALLLVFRGTIPVNFRGSTYRFPIALWIPHAYPYDAPMCYVTPTEDMMIRPGQHVGGDGRIYHPYLAHWREHWERSNILDFLSVLSNIFAKEPPVMSRTAQPQQRSAQPTPPPVPPLPREMQPPQQDGPVRNSFRCVYCQRFFGTQDALNEHIETKHETLRRHGISPGPPPPPPKPHTQSNIPYHPSPNAGPSGMPPKPGRYDAPPPLPPQDQGQPQRPPHPYGNGDVQRPPSGMNYTHTPQRSSSLRPALPPQQQPASEHQQYRSQPPRPGEAQLYAQPDAGRQPPSVMSPPLAPGQTAGYGQAQPPPLDQFRQGPGPMQQGHPERPTSQYYPPTQQPHQQPQPHYYPHQQQQAPQPAPPPPPNLLDSPFDLPLPAPTSSHQQSNIPAPPIPVNPEKDALLSHLSHLLTTSLHQQISQNASALQPLSSQHAALQQTMHLLNNELTNLKQLHSTLSSNISLLQSSLAKADGTISSAHTRASRNEIPAVDEMLTAPTVVARQLYDAACEERGIEAAILALQEGFVRGRVGSEVWARRTRELAREGFKRRWMVRKIGGGMGLDLDAGSYGR